ncbi:hypothetical protein [Epilithonimonas vandammei]|uniref:hypothetical protein n=1 Tax=Epilithonimonas vandammei TaxID=2487072 RepID=UPI00289716B0|nr:hypothetical protein [Epilithonimonas vandammei]
MSKLTDIDEKLCLIVNANALAEKLRNRSYKIINNGRKQRYTRRKSGYELTEH